MSVEFKHGKLWFSGDALEAQYSAGVARGRELAKLEAEIAGEAAAWGVVRRRVVLVASAAFVLGAAVGTLVPL
jgi:hypothetical protein